MESVKQAAVRWKVSEPTVIRWAQEGIIKAEKFAGSWAIKQRSKPKIKPGRPFKTSGEVDRV